QPGPGDRAGRVGVRVLADEHPAGRRGRPDGRVVGDGTRERTDGRPRPVAPGGIGQRGRAEPREVTAFVARRRASGELVADRVRLLDGPGTETEGLRPVRRDSAAAEDGSTDRGVTDERRVELAAPVGAELAATREDPVGEVALVEVDVDRRTGE